MDDIREKLIRMRGVFAEEGDDKGVHICNTLLREFRNPIGRIIVVSGVVAHCDTELITELGYSLTGRKPSEYLAAEYLRAALDHIEAGSNDSITVGILRKDGTTWVADAQPRHAHEDGGLWIRVVTFYPIDK